MAVLEAMSVGVPVVVCPDCGLAPSIRDTGSGKVANGTVEDLTTAVKSVLSDAGAYGERARETARRDFGMGAVADRLLGIYRVAATR